MKKFHIGLLAISCFLFLAPSFRLCAGDVISFAIVTDSHVTWIQGQATKCLRAVVEDINTRPIDFVVHLGDEANIGSNDQFNITRDVMNELRAPYYVIPGNHDGTWSESGGTNFIKAFGSDHFCFKFKGWRFVGCPSGPQVHIVKPAMVPRESMQWIETLEPDSHSIFFMHCPLGPGNVYNSDEFLKLIRSKGATILLGGHTHVDQSYDYNGLPGAVCRNTESTKAHPGYGYSIVRIGNNTLTISECCKGESGFYEKEPWYSVQLKPEESIIPVPKEELPTATCREYTKLPPGEGEVWRSLDNANIISGFAVDAAAGRAFYGNTAGEMKCLDLKDGSIVWTFRMKGKIFSVPAYEDGILVTGCATGEIVGLDASTGKKLWTVKTQNALIASPVIHKGIAYIGSSDNAFRAIDIKKGRIVWMNNAVTGFVQRALYIDDEQLVVADWNRTVYSFNPESGDLQWKWLEEKRHLTFSAGGSTIVKAGGKIFFGVPDRHLHVLDAKTGRQLWVSDGEIVRESLGLSEDGQTVYVKSQDGIVSAIPVEGDYVPKWSTQVHKWVDTCRSAILCRDGVVYVPAFHGYIYLLDGKDGTILKTHRVTTTALNPIDIIPGYGILASSIDGYIVCKSDRYSGHFL